MKNLSFPGLPRILVIDDEPVVLDVLRALLTREGYEVETAPDAATGRARVESDAPWDVVLLDVLGYGGDHDGRPAVLGA